MEKLIPDYSDSINIASFRILLDLLSFGAHVNGRTHIQGALGTLKARELLSGDTESQISNFNTDSFLRGFWER